MSLFRQCNSRGNSPIGHYFFSIAIYLLLGLLLSCKGMPQPRKNMQIITSTYLYHWSGGIWIKSNHHTSHGSGKCPWDLWIWQTEHLLYTFTSYSGRRFLVILFIPWNHQGVSLCTSWSLGSWAPIGKIVFWLGPNRICLSGSKFPPFCCHALFLSSAVVC